MNSITRESVSISAAIGSVLKAPLSAPALTSLLQLTAHAELLGTAMAGGNQRADKEVSHESP